MGVILALERKTRQGSLASPFFPLPPRHRHPGHTLLPLLLLRCPWTPAGGRDEAVETQGGAGGAGGEAQRAVRLVAASITASGSAIGAPLVVMAEGDEKSIRLAEAHGD